MTTGVPSGSCASFRITSLSTRTHPCDTSSPIEPGSLVPWIAICGVTALELAERVAVARQPDREHSVRRVRAAARGRSGRCSRRCRRGGVVGRADRRRCGRTRTAPLWSSVSWCSARLTLICQSSGARHRRRRTPSPSRSSRSAGWGGRRATNPGTDRTRAACAATCTGSVPTTCSPVVQPRRASRTPRCRRPWWSRRAAARSRTTW